jgi:hypothetical protein
MLERCLRNLDVIFYIQRLLARTEDMGGLFCLWCGSFREAGNFCSSERDLRSLT